MKRQLLCAYTGFGILSFFEGFSDKATRDYECGTATRDDIDFGYGVHHRPRKAVGCNMLKIFLTQLLEMYDLEPEEGVTERYKDVHLGQYVSDTCKVFHRARLWH